MKHPKLAVEPRSVLGKEVKKLRREGLLPANIYGKEIKSLAVQMQLTDFTNLHKEVGETGLVDVDIEGKARPVLFKNIQWNYQTHTPLHVDLFQVNLKEKLRVMVPLLLTGEAAAVSGNVGILLQQLSEIEVEALPENLPENLELSVEALAAVGDQLTVADLKAPANVVIHSEPGQIIVKIAELAQEEPEEVAPEPEGEAGAPVAGEETPKAEGESEAATPEEKPQE